MTNIQRIGPSHPPKLLALLLLLPSRAQIAPRAVRKQVPLLPLLLQVPTFACGGGRRGMLPKLDFEGRNGHGDMF